MQQSCLRCHIGKCAVAVIVVKPVVTVVGQEQIFKPVIIVVANAHPNCPTWVGEAGFGRDIGKAAVTIVVVEAVARAGRCSIKGSAAEEKQVHPAVIVVVDESATAAH